MAPVDKWDIFRPDYDKALQKSDQRKTQKPLEAAVEQGRSRSNRSPEQQTARLGLSVTQSLLRGLGPAVNLVSVRQAELDYTASLGDSTSLLVAQAQRDLLAARLAEVESIVNYRIALVELFLAEGSLLERRGMAMGPGGG